MAQELERGLTGRGGAEALGSDALRSLSQLEVDFISSIEGRCRGPCADSERVPRRDAAALLQTVAHSCAREACIVLRGKSLRT
eukprot:6372621-Prymnesium_polylepis.2